VNIRKSILLRVRIAFVAVLLFAMLVVGRIAQIQWVEGSKWAEQAQKEIFEFDTVPATRGNIYAENGSLLATSLPFYKVAFDPTVVRQDSFDTHIATLAQNLAGFFNDYDARTYKERIEVARANGREYMYLSKKRIGYQAKKELSSWPIFRLGRMKGGIIFEKVDRRFLPFGFLAQRTIGFLNEENQGAGLEYSFRGQLAGRNGSALFQKISGNSRKKVNDGHAIRPQDGYDIVTTIDVNLQDVAQDALLRALRTHEANYGSVVVMEVATGQIKAICNLSKYPDPDNRGAYLYGERYNYAVGSQGNVEPGSTFKLASMMALFEDTNLRLTDTVQTGNGKYRFYNQTMTDAKPGGYGALSIEESFAKSSNIAVSKLVEHHFGLQPQRYVDYLRTFGLTQPLGFQMRGTGKPYIKDPNDKKNWSGTTLPWMSIGYETTLTPLQILTFYNAVANGGNMVRPLIVKEIRQADRVIESYPTTTIKKRICSPETLQKVQRMLEAVVQYGTASNINNAHYKVAGKTGTAQKLVNGKYSKKSYYTSFAGYFPANAPKYSCIVVIDNPQGYNSYGSDVAAPVFKEIADKIYAQDLGMHQTYAASAPNRAEGVFPVIRAGNRADLTYLCNKLGVPNNAKTTDEWTRAQRDGYSVAWTSANRQVGKVPNVVGMTLKDALFLLENAGLRVRYKGMGRVATQTQPPGQKALQGSTITLTLSQ